MDGKQSTSAGGAAPCGGLGLVAAVARRLGLFAGLWLVLAGGEALLVGVAVVATSSWLSLRLLPPVRPLHLWRMIAIVPGFLRRSLLGGIDVARRAFDPRLPLNPGWIALDVDLPDGGKVVLGGELSLMPGTLVAGSDGRRLLMHVLDRHPDVEGAARIEGARLGRAFGQGAGENG